MDTKHSWHNTIMRFRTTCPCQICVFAGLLSPYISNHNGQMWNWLSHRGRHMVFLWILQLAIYCVSRFQDESNSRLIFSHVTLLSSFFCIKLKHKSSVQFKNKSSYLQKNLTLNIGAIPLEITSVLPIIKLPHFLKNTVNDWTLFN